MKRSDWFSKSFKVSHCSVINVLCFALLRQLDYFIKSLFVCQALFYFLNSVLSSLSCDSLFILSKCFAFVKNFFHFLLHLCFKAKESAGGGIRTHAPLRTNGFQDRLVMTTSIPLHESGWWESNPRIQLGRLVFYHWTTPAYLIVHKSGWQDSNLRPPGPKPGALAKLSHTPICRFAVSFLLPHRSDSDIISLYSILVNTFLHFFEINFSNTIHTAVLQCFQRFETTVLLTS